MIYSGQTIVFFGDSITRGEFGANFITELEQRMLRDTDVDGLHLINAGRNGDTVGDLLDRASSDVLPHSPDLVVIMIGINDTFSEDTFAPMPQDMDSSLKACRRMVGAFAGKYSMLIDKLVQGLAAQKATGSITGVTPEASEAANKKTPNIVLCTTTAIEEHIPASIRERQSLINDVVRSLAHDKHCGLIDVHDAFKQKLEALYGELKTDNNVESSGYKLTIDGVHLNKEGALLVASSMFDYLTA